MNRITAPQLTAMMVISDLFALMCYEGGLSVYSAAGIAAGTALQFVMAVPFAIAADTGKNLPDAVKLILAGGVILWCGSLLNGLRRASDITFVPYENAGGTYGKLFIIVMVLAVCLYISYEGIKAASRSAVIVAAAGAAVLLADLASALRPSEFGNISASVRFGTFTGGLLISFATGGSSMAFVLMLPYVQGRKRRAAVMYFSCRLVMCTAVVMTAVLTAGGIMDIAEFPVIMSAQLSQPFSSQRTDALFLMLFAVYGVFALTGQLMTASVAAGDIFPKFSKWRSTAVLVLSLAAMGLFTGCTSTGQVHDKSYVRCVGVSGDRLTLAFFSGDEIITSEGSDIGAAMDEAVLTAGRPVVTGFTELIILGDCDRKAVLGYMLKEWKVSPSCMVIYSEEPENTMKETLPSVLEGRLKEAIKQGKARKCDIVTVLGGM